MSNESEGKAGINADDHQGSQPRDPGTRQQDLRDLQILHVCRRPLTAPQVIAASGISRSSVDRRLRRLSRNGLLDRMGEAFRTTDAGKAALAGHRDLRQPVAKITDLWPFLKRMPTPLHGALAILMLLAVIAKGACLAPDDMPTFCLLGKSGRLKTWLLKVLGKVLGLSLDDCLTQTPQARARSLIARQDGQGNLVWTNPALAGKLYGLLEVSKAKTDIMEDVATLQQGKSPIFIDGKQVDINAVIALEMNYLKESEDRYEQTRFDQSQRRRAFIGDFTTIEISDNAKATCWEYFESLPSGESVQLPEPPKEPLPEKAKEYIRTVIKECVKPECRDEIDIGRVETLVRAARALYSDPVTAAQFVLNHVLEVYGSTRIAKDEWRSAFAIISSSAGQYPLALVPQVSQGNPVSTQTWEYVREDLKGHGLDPSPISNKIAALLQVFRKLREQNLSDAEIFSLLENLQKLLLLNYLLHSLGMEPEQALALQRIKQTLASCKCDESQAQEAIDTLHALNGMGLTSEAALEFAYTINSHLENGGDGAHAARELLELARQSLDVQCSLAYGESQLKTVTEVSKRLDQQVAQLSEYRQDLCNIFDSLANQCDALRARIGQLEQQESALEKACLEKQCNVDALQQRENAIRARSLALLVLYRLFFDPEYNIQLEVRKAIEDLFWAIKSNGTMGNLEDAYEKIARLGEATRATFDPPLDEFELLETALARKKAECRQARQSMEAFEGKIAELCRTWHLLKAFQVCVSHKAGQEVLRANLLAEFDRLNGIMAGRLKCLDPQAEVDAISERIRLFIAGGLGLEGEQGSGS